MTLRILKEVINQIPQVMDTHSYKEMYLLIKLYIKLNFKLLFSKCDGYVGTSPIDKALIVLAIVYVLNRNGMKLQWTLTTGFRMLSKSTVLSKEELVVRFKQIVEVIK